MPCSEAEMFGGTKQRTSGNERLFGDRSALKLDYISYGDAPYFRSLW